MSQHLHLSTYIHMGSDKLPERRTRRDFLSLFTSKDKKAVKPQMVKMLTPDGKLVEVDKAILEQAISKQKVCSKDIFNWMKNPSKENG